MIHLTKANQALVKFNITKIYRDPDIQRKRGNWDKPTKNSALSAYNRSRVSASIVLVSVRDCLEYIKLQHPLDTQSIRYYSDRLNEGKEYIVLDGMHKWFDVVTAFFNNEWSFSGSLRDADGKRHIIVNKYYKDLPQRVKDSLNDMTIPFFLVQDAPLAELSTLFIDHQKGKPLNPMQKRHAIRTPLSPWVRTFAESLHGLWPNIAMKRNRSIEASGDYELVAKFLCALVREWRGELLCEKNNENYKLSDGDLDKLYEAGESIQSIDEDNSPYVPAELARAREIISIFSNIVILGADEGTSKKLQSATMWLMLFAAEYIYDNGLSVDDPVAFCKTVNEIHRSLVKEAKKQYASDLINFEQAEATAIANNTANTVKEPSPRDYYDWWITVVHTGPERNYAKNKFIATLKQAKWRKQSTLTGHVAQAAK